jgi:hypothetical protein
MTTRTNELAVNTAKSIGSPNALYDNDGTWCIDDLRLHRSKGFEYPASRAQLPIPRQSPIGEAYEPQ